MNTQPPNSPLATRHSLLIFDLDGTLVQPFTATLLPGVHDWFTAVRHQPTPPPAIAIATNQGGVALHYHYQWYDYTPDKSDKYPDIIEAKSRVFDIANQLHIPQTAVYISFAYRFPKDNTWANTPIQYALDPRWSRNWRKPNPGMINQAIAHHKTTPAEALYIGDRNEDREAARRAGCHFTLAKDFFKLQQLVPSPFKGEG